MSIGVIAILGCKFDRLYQENPLSTVKISKLWFTFFKFWKASFTLSTCLNITLLILHNNLSSFSNLPFHHDSKLMTSGLQVQCLIHTAKNFTVKTAGFHCIRFPTVVPLYFTQSSNIYSGSLQSSCNVTQIFKFCSLMAAISTIRNHHFLRQITADSSNNQLQILLMSQCSFYTFTTSN